MTFLPTYDFPKELPDDLWARGPEGDPVVTWLTWTFHHAAQVTGFELRGLTGGLFLSLRVGNVEQMAEPEWLPVVLLRGRSLTLPVVEPGIALTLQTSGFKGEIRPLGRYVR